MKIDSICLIVILSLFLSCKNENSQKENELQHKKNEISTNENVNSKSKTETKLPKEINEISNVENVVGNWFIPHNADVNIKFTQDGKFIFNDFNTQIKQFEVLTGEYKLENDIITLLYVDRAKQKFKITKGTNGDTNFYITKGENYYFAKGEN